jgi:hypothetical protein
VDRCCHLLRVGPAQPIRWDPNADDIVPKEERLDRMQLPLSTKKSDFQRQQEYICQVGWWKCTIQKRLHCRNWAWTQEQLLRGHRIAFIWWADGSLHSIWNVALEGWAWRTHLAI